MAHAFLSPEWIDAARAIRERHRGEGTPEPPLIRMNLMVSGAPFGDGSVSGHVDTSRGDAVIEVGVIAGADVTVTTDYDTARSIFVMGDPATAMRSFLSGKVVVQGDMMKLIALQGAAAADPAAGAIAAEIRAITAP